MSEREWRTDDKSTWGNGAWQEEPDKVQWVDAATGLDCLIRRNRGGALCGYVGVPEAHPWFGKEYGDVPDVEVHGGLTFASFCHEPDGEDRDRPIGMSVEEWRELEMPNRICHVPEPGRPDRVWWFGFDCAHSWDVSPASDARMREIAPHLAGPDMHATYKGVGFVKHHAGQLASQLKEAALSAGEGSGSDPREER